MRTNSSTFAIMLTAIVLPVLISCGPFSVKQAKDEPNNSVFVKASIQKLSIEGKGRFRIFLKQTDQDGYKIEADPEQLALLNVSDEGNRLKINGGKKTEPYRHEITVWLHVKNINEITTASACNIQFENTFTEDTLSMETTGVNNVTGALNVKKLDINDSGVNNFNLSGKAEQLVLDKSGVGSFNALDLEAQIGIINLSGVGSVRVNITKTAEFSSNGIAKISYKGNPEIKKSDKSGLSIIRKL